MIQAQYTSTASAFRLTATPATGVAYPATDPSQYGQRPVGVYLQAEVEDIRFTVDESTPTSSHGMILTADAEPFFWSGGIPSLRFIQAASGAKLNVVYTLDLEVKGAIGATGPEGPIGAETFIELTDAPASYSGAAGKMVAVNGTHDALEFVDAGDVVAGIETVRLFDADGLIAADRPAIETQVLTVSVAAFNDLRTALIALGVITDGD